MTKDIWVVDDNPAVTESTVVLLLSYGFAAKAYMNTKSVINDLEFGEMPSVMVLDLKMPYNGVTLLEKILNTPHWIFPLIISTGVDVPLSERLENRVWTTFMKPVNPIEFIETVRHILQME